MARQKGHYHTYAELTALLEGWRDRWPSLCQLESIGHALWEMIQWADTYVKDAEPREAAELYQEAVDMMGGDLEAYVDVTPSAPTHPHCHHPLRLPSQVLDGLPRCPAAGATRTVPRHCYPGLEQPRHRTLQAARGRGLPAACPRRLREGARTQAGRCESFGDDGANLDGR